MRRHDRETSYEEAVTILRGCPFATVAFHGGEYPYAVPMHFGVAEENGALVLYFHGAKEGKKLGLLAENSRVAFSAVRYCENVPPKNGIACTATARFESVFGEGELSPVSGEDAERGLRVLLAQNGMKGEIPPAALAKTCVPRLSVSPPTGKRHECPTARREFRRRAVVSRTSRGCKQYNK